MLLPSGEVQFAWAEDRARLISTAKGAEGVTQFLSNYFQKPARVQGEGMVSTPDKMVKALFSTFASPVGVKTQPKPELENSDMKAAPGLLLLGGVATSSAEGVGESGCVTPIKVKDHCAADADGGDDLDESMLAPPVR